MRRSYLAAATLPLTDMTSHFHKGQIFGWEARLASGIVQRAGQLS